MSTNQTSRMRGSMPSISTSTLMLMIISGSVATVFFDIWGQVISPGVLGWAALAPQPLAQATLRVLFDINSKAGGHFMHLFLVGLIGYPLGYLFIFRPIFEKVLPGLHWFIGAAIYGFGLFVFAIGIMAGPLVAGNPWFLGFSGITWVALIGHVLYGIVCAWIINMLERKGFG
ncbi:MAG: hypothetical protein OXR62_01710 [Ahrensia sp.]|nr:hypothetical protein [Ahrensia sp.]